MLEIDIWGFFEFFWRSVMYIKIILKVFKLDLDFKGNGSGYFYIKSFYFDLMGIYWLMRFYDFVKYVLRLIIYS